MDDVTRVRVPTPFEVGPVNCYVFDADELTILDPGPATDDAYDAIADHLEELGATPEDVDRVLITHPHMDHFGLAARVVEASDAEVLAHRDATRQLEDPRGYFDREQALFRPFLQSMGVPGQIVDTVVSLPEPYTDFQEPVGVDRELDDGDVVDVGVDLTVVHTPGHAPGSVCFVPATERVAFTGDHVLEHISPNPLLTLEPGTETERTRSLPTYLDSLQRLLEVDAEVAHCGHGADVPDLETRVHEILEHHEHRKERIAGMIDELGPTTAYEIMQEMFPDLPVTEAFAGMSEVIGHLDLLEDEGRVEITDVDGVWRYSLC